MRPFKSLRALAALAVITLPSLVLADYEQSTIEMHIGPVTSVGFATVEEAYEKLSNRASAQVRTNREGWTEIEDTAKNVLWSFVPEDHPAYPTVIKRTVTGRGYAMQIDMDGLCEAQRKDCEKLMRQLKTDNEIARTQFIRKPPRGAAAKADVTPIGSLMSAAP